MPPKEHHTVQLCCRRPNPEGIEVVPLRGRILFWQCTNCHSMWHRWKEGSMEWALAEVTMEKWTKRLASVRAKFLEERDADTQPPGK